MRKLFALVVVLWAAALGRDAADDWIDRTELPVLVRAASTEIRDRDGQLLRAYTVGDGRWRMALSLDQVDPLFFDMLIAYEDRRFPDHPGVDAIATARAVCWPRGLAAMEARRTSLPCPAAVVASPPRSIR